MLTDWNELTDEELYDRSTHGDPRAFEQLYERREPGLYRYALHMSGNHAIAEEATHEAFLGLIKPGSRFAPRLGSVEAYLYGAVRNLSRRMRPALPVASQDGPAPDDDILGALIGDEMTSALHAAIRELPDAYREAVVLCDLEERSYEEAAHLMSCPIGTVRSRLYRARAILGAKLKALNARPEAAAR